MARHEILKLLNEDLKNERMHLQFYLYHASAVTGLHAAEYREFLTDAAKGELEHVQQFQDRIWGLGGEPTLDSNAFPTFTFVEHILAHAHKIEQQVVANYATRIAQVQAWGEPESNYLSIFYEDQLQDSYEDAERMRRILAGLG
jgi:bacterioferritin (cytochrome b1)